MYTQCPECQVAFRVTAQVLQQAAGNVRCGSCGHAFSALQYLSEEMPEPTAPPANDEQAEETVDELAETSRRLLETLDELAGPEDVRIEDTGVEWRVLDSAAAEDVKLSPDEIPPEDEIRYDDNTPLPDDFGEDDAGEPPPIPQRREEDHKPKTEEFEERQGDLALSEPEDWTDILEEVRDPNAEALEVEEELVAIHNELTAIDESLTDEVPQLEDESTDSADGDEPDEDEADLIEQIEAGAAAELADDDDADPEVDEETGSFEALDADDEIEEEESSSYERESTGEFDAQINEAARALGDDEAPGDESDDKSDEETADEPLALTDEDENEDTEEAEDDVALAGPDDDNPEPEEADASDEQNFDDMPVEPESAEDSVPVTLAGIDNPEELFNENSDEVETIIMEGEFIRSEVEKERMAAENAARNQLDDSSRLVDTYALQRGKVRGGRRSYDPPSNVMLGAIVVLGLVLIGQLVHNFRQPLATFGFFNATIAPVYRMLGNPIAPDWDIKGWQFEATNGSVENEESTLVIATRIANRSSEPLPYPLVHVSLTNRFEDVIGSRILEPGEYLAEDGDPSRLVDPGQNFNALITVEEASADATGFKLYVCYRIEPGSVRCANEDFKD